MKQSISLHFLFKNAAFVTAFLFFLALHTSGAQDFREYPPVYKIGVHGGFNWNFHSADFKELPGVENCCPVFEGGRGNGLSGGLTYEYIFAPQLSIGIKAMYSQLDAVLKGLQPTDVVAEDTIRPGEFEHSIMADISVVSLAPVIIFNPAGRLYLQAGVRFGGIITKQYRQQEKITQPASGVFKENGRRIRNERSGEIPQAGSFQSSLLFGAYHEFPLNRPATILLSPELLFQLTFSEIIANTAWRTNLVTAGITIKYGW